LIYSGQQLFYYISIAKYNFHFTLSSASHLPLKGLEWKFTFSLVLIRAYRRQLLKAQQKKIFLEISEGSCGSNISLRNIYETPMQENSFL